MTRRRPGTNRTTEPGSAPYHDPLRPSRPAWVRVVVFVMLAALILSAVGGFLIALG
jgi:hypothetical protein